MNVDPAQGFKTGVGAVEQGLVENGVEHGNKVGEGEGCCGFQKLQAQAPLLRKLPSLIPKRKGLIPEG